MVNQQLQRLLLESIANGSVDKGSLPHLVSCTLLSHQVTFTLPSRVVFHSIQHVLCTHILVEKHTERVCIHTRRVGNLRLAFPGHR